MEKTKKIIISLVVSFVIVVALVSVIMNKSDATFKEVLVYKKDYIKGDKISKQDVECIKIKKSETIENLLESALSIEDISEKVLTNNVNKGQIVVNQDVVKQSDLSEEISGYKNISIPITSSSNVICKNLKQGDKVTVYFTGKTESVSKIVSNKQKVYSNGQSTGMVTCILVKDAEFISAYNSSGTENSESIITDVLLRIKEEDAILAINLKSIGDFDIVKE